MHPAMPANSYTLVAAAGRNYVLLRRNGLTRCKFSRQLQMCLGTLHRYFFHRCLTDYCSWTNFQAIFDYMEFHQYLITFHK